jgi:hypothetical protein
MFRKFPLSAYDVQINLVALDAWRADVARLGPVPDGSFAEFNVQRAILNCNVVGMAWKPANPFLIAWNDEGSDAHPFVQTVDTSLHCLCQECNLPRN